ncbi:MAG: hypothetical protein WKF58_15605 [Ilumatobacteraceae bacterium]
MLARWLASELATCDEIHVATHGTAGPSCAREHHRALGSSATGWHDGTWIERRGGSGRELCWFPEPVGAYDCYRADLAEPTTLHRALPNVTRISARASATRRDRFTSWLPMLTPPHREGRVGALRAEARGARADGGRATLIAGIAERVGTASGATAAAFADAAARGRLPRGRRSPATLRCRLSSCCSPSPRAACGCSGSRVCRSRWLVRKIETRRQPIDRCRQVRQLLAQLVGCDHVGHHQAYAGELACEELGVGLGVGGDLTIVLALTLVA